MFSRIQAQSDSNLVRHLPEQTKAPHISSLQRFVNGRVEGPTHSVAAAGWHVADRLAPGLLFFKQGCVLEKRMHGPWKEVTLLCFIPMRTCQVPWRPMPEQHQELKPARVLQIEFGLERRGPEWVQIPNRDRSFVKMRIGQRPNAMSHVHRFHD